MQNNDWHRRGFLKFVLSAVSTLAAGLNSTHLFAQQNDKLQVALLAFTNGVTPILDIENKVLELELERVIENGYSVPVKLIAHHPINDSVIELGLFSSGNPFAKIAGFYFPNAHLVPQVNTRIRLSNDQNVFLLAKTASGKIYQTHHAVQVAIGGCSV